MSSQELVEQFVRHFLNFMFHTTVQQSFDGEKYIYFINNLLLFPTVKNFQNRLTVDKLIVKISTPRFFLRHGVCKTRKLDNIQLIAHSTVYIM